MTQRIHLLDEARLAHLPGSVEHYRFRPGTRSSVARSSSGNLRYCATVPVGNTGVATEEGQR